MKNKFLNGDYINPALPYISGDEIKYVISKPLTVCNNGFLPENSLTNGNETIMRGKIYNFHSVLHNSNIFTVAEHELCRGMREITVFCGIKRILLGSGKVTNPCLAVLGDRIYCCFEESVFDGYRKNLIRIFAFNGLLENISEILLNCTGREYCPQICSSDSELVMITEAFDSGRYTLLARRLVKDGFSDAFLIGTGENNDQSPSVAFNGNNFILAFENSKCLSKGYVYELFPDITIPVFGHGWRIETSLYTREFTVRDGKFYAGEPDLFRLSEGKSDGVFTLYSDPGQLFGSFYRFDSAKHKYLISVCQLNGDGWREIYREQNGALMKKPVSMMYCNGILHVSHLTCGEQSGLNITEIPVIAAENINGTFTKNELASCRFLYKPVKRKHVNINGETYNIYFGDLHMHSNISRCSLHYGFHCSEIEDKYRICSDLAGLDFAMCTDHDTMNRLDWARTCEAADFADNNGSFTAFNGYEWTSSMYKDGKPNFGHQNILYPDRGELYKCRGTGTDSITELWNKLDGTGALTIPHHTADAFHPFDWNYYSDKYQTAAEIFNVRGSYEFDNCEMYPENYGRATVSGLSLDMALKKGYKLAFTSGGEHEGCGITMIFSGELSRPAIYDALKNRHVYGSSGARVIAAFYADNAFMGSTIKPNGNITLRLEVEADDNIKRIRLMKNSVTEAEWTEFGTVADLKYIVSAERAYYYFTVMLQHNEMCWISPIWVE